MKALTRELKTQATRLGFVLCGVSACAQPQRLLQFHAWLDAGYAGQMHYLGNRREAYADPRMVLDGCRSIVMLGLPYATEARDADYAVRPLISPLGKARVARYATGTVDYHDLIHGRLQQLKDWLLTEHPEAAVRGVVDTAPLLEREFAEMAGLGWVGKNTLLLNRTWGSYFFLAALLTDLELVVDPPSAHNYCGTCTACLTACPTNAFPSPFVLDATRCISYLTIEHRDPIDDRLKSSLGDWVFGCDICQEVCPWNRNAQASQEQAFAPVPELESFDLLAALDMSDEQFRRLYRKTPLWRSRRRGMLRNAILCVGNRRLEQAYPALCRLLSDSEPLIRGAAAWAVGQLQCAGWEEQLSDALPSEADPDVRDALQRALSA